MTTLSSMRERIRQHRFPPEFRIAEPVWPVEPPVAAAQAPAAPHEPPRIADLTDTVVAKFVTDLWRTTRKVGDGDADPARRRVAKHLRAAWDTLAEAGVKAEDYEGLAWDPGMSLEVLTYELRPGMEREIVVETVRPSVYRAGRRIQRGQVIVGHPERGRT